MIEESKDRSNCHCSFVPGTLLKIKILESYLFFLIIDHFFYESTFFSVLLAKSFRMLRMHIIKNKSPKSEVICVSTILNDVFVLESFKVG